MNMLLTFLMCADMCVYIDIDIFSLIFLLSERDSPCRLENWKRSSSNL